uniref:Uncharacterized protein n=1 Tax=Octopus bimaculoides TaxID=37653 RepID=A0A0L8FU04_OCTBM
MHMNVTPSYLIQHFDNVYLAHKHNYFETHCTVIMERKIMKLDSKLLQTYVLYGSAPSLLLDLSSSTLNYNNLHCQPIITIPIN